MCVSCAVGAGFESKTNKPARAAITHLCVILVPKNTKMTKKQ